MGSEVLCIVEEMLGSAAATQMDAWKRLGGGGACDKEKLPNRVGSLRAESRA